MGSSRKHNRDSRLLRLLLRRVSKSFSLANLKNQLVAVLASAWNKILRGVPQEIQEDVRTLASLFLKVAFPRSHFLASAVIKRWQLKSRPSIDDKVLLVMWRVGQVSIQDATGAPCRQCRDSRKLKASRYRRLTGTNVTTCGTLDKHVATHLHGEPFVNMTAVLHGT